VPPTHHPSRITDVVLVALTVMSLAAPALGQTDASDRTTFRAVRIQEPLVLDGRLDEEIYRQVPPQGGFVQQEPNEGAPATEATDVWMFFDDRHVYVSARMHLSQPDRLTANELRRDSINIFRNDYFGLAIDTMFDRRSGLFVMTNPLGAQRDALVTDESRAVNFDYNAIWDVKSHVAADAWSAEFAIPFKSLRYQQRREQVWNVLIGRVDWWKNEFSFLTPVPRADGTMGTFRISAGATLTGIEAPPPALNLDIKPYVAASSTTLPAGGRVDTDYGRDAGVDVRYAMTSTLGADFTYNTDFAQAEVDDQQINLTRFSLFYPEKREFFLEGQGLFSFGGANTSFGGAGETPLMFFSRRIGLHEGRTVPIQAGGRLMGKAGPYNIGVLSIGSDAVPEAGLAAARSSVMRVKRDIFSRSSVGVIVTERSPALAAASNQVVGADLSLALFRNVEAVTYYARSRTPERSGDAESYRGRFLFNGDKYGLDVDHLKVGEDFNPEVGFLARRDFRRTYLLARFSPRPNVRGIRRLSWDARLDNIAGASDDRLQTRSVSGSFRADFLSGDSVAASIERDDDRPNVSFPLPGGLVVRPGTYRYTQASIAYQVATQRRVNGNVSMTTGGFYGGDQTTLGYNGRVEITKQLAVEPRVSFTRLALNDRTVHTRLVSLRTTFGVNARMFVSTLLQYNSAARVVGLNARLRWEYAPGSDLFLVYSEGRDTAFSGFGGQSNRQVVAKVTRLFRF
jgi:hypothetical protein